MRIEKRLKKLSDENPNYSLLWAQWEFDKNFYHVLLIQLRVTSLTIVCMMLHIHPQ